MHLREVFSPLKSTSCFFFSLVPHAAHFQFLPIFFLFELIHGSAACDPMAISSSSAVCSLQAFQTVASSEFEFFRRIVLAYSSFVVLSHVSAPPQVSRSLDEMTSPLLFLPLFSRAGFVWSLILCNNVFLMLNFFPDSRHYGITKRIIPFPEVLFVFPFLYHSPGGFFPFLVMLWLTAATGCSKLTHRPFPPSWRTSRIVSSVCPSPGKKKSGSSGAGRPP